MPEATCPAHPNKMSPVCIPQALCLCMAHVATRFGNIIENVLAWPSHIEMDSSMRIAISRTTAGPPMATFSSDFLVFFLIFPPFVVMPRSVLGDWRVMPRHVFSAKTVMPQGVFQRPYYVSFILMTPRGLPQDTPKRPENEPKFFETPIRKRTHNFHLWASRVPPARRPNPHLIALGSCSCQHQVSFFAHAPWPAFHPHDGHRINITSTDHRTHREQASVLS